MKTQIKLNVIGIQEIGDGRVAILTKPSKQNPSPNGTHVMSEQQIKRIAKRTLGFESARDLKNLVELSNGAAVLTIDAEDCKTGDSFKKANGETGTYTKDWTKYSNHELKLGIVAQMKLTEISLNFSLANATQVYSAPKAAPVVVDENEEQPTA